VEDEVMRSPVYGAAHPLVKLLLVNILTRSAKKGHPAARPTGEQTMAQQPDWLLWLADAPMFIDDNQVERFYDAVVRPVNKEGTTTIQFSEESAQKLQGALKGKVGLKSGALLGWLGTVFAFLPGLEAEVGAEGGGELASKNAKSNTVVLYPISNATRQLVQLSLYYLANRPERVVYADGATANWYNPAVVAELPRALLALNLPGWEEAEKKKLPKTKLIPVAAEFTNGTVVTYFDKIKPKPDEGCAPKHPDFDDPGHAEKKKEYWKWYADHFHIGSYMDLVEESVRIQGCRIQWIDYRVPISNDGNTLHLHIVAGGKYDTITFAYNFIRRGFEFGIRLIGLVKTDPDLNVLAIYER
jgi:hypothetical protein